MDTQFKVGDIYTYEDPFYRNYPITVEIIEVYSRTRVKLKILKDNRKYPTIGRICNFGTDIGIWTKISQSKYPRIATKFLEGLQI